MQYEDIVYKAGILEMAVRLEALLRNAPNVNDPKKTLGELIGDYAGKADPKVLAVMNRINEDRNACAHSPIGGMVSNHQENFEVIRGKCAELGAPIAGKFRGDPRSPGEVMISCSLRYDMGNAGDIIKHGILAEFTEWWCQCNQRNLRYADPFGGRPWGEAKDESVKRIRMLRASQRALAHAQNAGQQSKELGRIAIYYGSSHVVLNAAQKRATVFADDSDKLARADLKSSGLHIISEDKRLFPGYNPGDGYAILRCAKSANLDLILIDPYREFMRDEFLVAAGEKRFSAVVEAAEANPDLWIAVFVLDWRKTSTKYKEFRDEKLAGRAIGLRCEPIKKGILDGEDSYAMELLLVSDRLRLNREPHIRRLLKRIKGLENNFPVSGAKVTPIGLDKVGV